MYSHASGRGDRAESAGVDYPAHQVLKTIDRTVYCSKNRVRNHDEGADWVAGCMEHFGIRADDLRGRPYLAQDCPAGATVWP